MNKKNLKAYSLLELLVTIAIFAILVAMITQVLVLSVNTGRKIAIHSKVKGDLSEIAVMIRRDFRNVGKINESKCSNATGDRITLSNAGTEISFDSACFFNVAGINYAWVFNAGGSNPLCPEGKICKLKRNNGGDYELFYQTPDSIKFNPATRFELSTSNSPQSDNKSTRGLFLASLSADVSKEYHLDLPTQYKQVIVFTRNF